MPPALAERLIDHLTTKSRLLRPVSGRSGVRYELAHEYLTLLRFGNGCLPPKLRRREAQRDRSQPICAHGLPFDSLRLGRRTGSSVYDEHARDLTIDEDVGDPPSS